MNAPWLVTGAAGFIGYHLCRRLSDEGRAVVAVDDLTPTYEPALKEQRLDRLRSLPGVAFVRTDIADADAMAELFARRRPDRVVHLAARAGVRGSHLDPLAYVRTNVLGFATVLDQARRHEVPHVLYASSSSVYGDTSPVPFRVRDPADHPISVYAATKRADELLAHSYAHAYGLATTGVRFFTVYGPWGRPDMAYFAFADAILAGRPVTVYGDGTALRDFTYVDDAVDAVVGLTAERPDGPGHPDEGGAAVPWRLYNVGHGSQASVSDLLDLLEERLGTPAERVRHPEQPGDVAETFADVAPLERVVGQAPATPLTAGLDRFVPWLQDYRAQHAAPRSA
jgi:UDP-glucuronate 4-epimerase